MNVLRLISQLIGIETLRLTRKTEETNTIFFVCINCTIRDLYYSHSYELCTRGMSDAKVRTLDMGLWAYN